MGSTHAGGIGKRGPRLEDLHQPQADAVQSGHTHPFGSRMRGHGTSVARFAAVMFVTRASTEAVCGQDAGRGE